MECRLNPCLLILVSYSNDDLKYLKLSWGDNFTTWERVCALTQLKENAFEGSWNSHVVLSQKKFDTSAPIINAALGDELYADVHSLLLHASAQPQFTCAALRSTSWLARFLFSLCLKPSCLAEFSYICATCQLHACGVFAFRLNVKHIDDFSRKKRVHYSFGLVTRCGCSSTQGNQWFIRVIVCRLSTFLLPCVSKTRCKWI